MNPLMNRENEIRARVSDYSSSNSDRASNDDTDSNTNGSLHQQASSTLTDRTINHPSYNLNFPNKLHTILSTPEFNDIICWLPHGRAWRVMQQERLESEVLPKFFKHNKYTSFARQVYGWGFNRIPSGPDYNAFYHELFVRDDPELRLKMKRPSKTELAEQRKQVSDSPPNFYAMSPVTAPADANDTKHQNTLAIISSPPMTLDEYREDVLKRLSTYSREDQGTYLTMELDHLEKKSARILHLLRLLQPEGNPGNDQQHQLVAGGPTGSNRTGQLPFPLSAVQAHQAHQQLPDPRNLNAAFLGSLNPWVQQAAQELYIEQQMQLRNTRNSDISGRMNDN